MAAAVCYRCLTADYKKAAAIIADFYLSRVQQSAPATAVCYCGANDGYLLLAFKQWISDITKLSPGEVSAIVRGPYFSLPELLQRVRQQQQDTAGRMLSSPPLAPQTLPLSPQAEAPTTIRRAHANFSQNSVGSRFSADFAPSTPAQTQEDTSAHEFDRGIKDALMFKNGKGTWGYVSSERAPRKIKLRAEAARQGVWTQLQHSSQVKNLGNLTLGSVF